MDRKKAIALSFSVPVAWGFSYPLMKIGMDSMNATSIVALRCIIAFVACLLLFHKRAFRINRDLMVRAAIIGAIMATELTCMCLGSSLTSASTAGFLQILIGVALGFTMQFAFAAVRTAGEIIGLQMGLSFATFVDPASHLNMPVLARIMDMLALLLFLTFNGHLWLISLLVDTFHTLPIGGEPLNSNAFLALTKAGSLIFLNGLMLALPLITLLPSDDYRDNRECDSGSSGALL